MIESIKKITKIIDEITTFFMSNGNEDLDISIKHNKTGFTIKFVVKGVNLSSSEINDIKESLDIQRQEDVEEYYWQLNGASESEMEFDLIGMMIDSHSIKQEDGNLILELIRND